MYNSLSKKNMGFAGAANTPAGFSCTFCSNALLTKASYALVYFYSVLHGVICKVLYSLGLSIIRYKRNI